MFKLCYNILKIKERGESIYGGICTNKEKLFR